MSSRLHIIEWEQGPHEFTALPVGWGDYSSPTDYSNYTLTYSVRKEGKKYIDIGVGVVVSHAWVVPYDEDVWAEIKAQLDVIRQKIKAGESVDVMDITKPPLDIPGPVETSAAVSWSDSVHAFTSCDDREEFSHQDGREWRPCEFGKKRTVTVTFAWAKGLGVWTIKGVDYDSGVWRDSEAKEEEVKYFAYPDKTKPPCYCMTCPDWEETMLGFIDWDSREEIFDWDEYYDQYRDYVWYSRHTCVYNWGVRDFFMERFFPDEDPLTVIWDGKGYRKSLGPSMKTAQSYFGKRVVRDIKCAVRRNLPGTVLYNTSSEEHANLVERVCESLPLCGDVVEVIENMLLSAH